MRSDTASALGLLAGLITTTAARPDLRYQQIRRQNAQDCLEDLEDILDDAPTTSLWPATACDFTSTLSGAELTTSYASFRILVNNIRIGNGDGGNHHSRIVDG
ncbi:hypothetical protein COL26b_008654 [Colletotrichum chrysophilum]|uniref:uncharacterized protein n=1 Tax=Colletotrichum chrysophilum TaxID=1836956 RepID=UPI002300D23D|nr:uncharacterized protein COL26b_008654 [Colletotrichum chrysophilum]KAJ0373172.1 hypothetical protein COL26b_008654 [Colletotrichum chrysophilum]